MAFEPLGWRPLAFSEIEAFPRAVLKHHYPDTPCHGDFTVLKDDPSIVDADMLCGGTPCQAFSVAGNRQSLADDRGNLTLQFVLLADAIDHLRSTAGREPAWILWENVPGVLSTNDNAFGAFLGGLVGRTSPIPEPADGWAGAGVVDGPTRCAAWRILDAQHFGLAQRRKRVFVLARGGAGRWAVADALLPIIESGRWHPAPSRGKGEGVAGTLKACANSGGWSNSADHAAAGYMIPATAHTLRGEGFDASEDGTGRGIPLVTAQFLHVNKGRPDGRQSDHEPMVSLKDHVPTLTTDGHSQSAVAYPLQEVNVSRANLHGTGTGIGEAGDPMFTLQSAQPHGVCASLSLRTREGVVSEDQSLTLATGNDQVLAYRIHGENSTAMQGNGVARVADPAELARCLDTCGGYSTNQGGNVVLTTHEVVGSLCAESGPNTHGSRGVSGTQTMLQGYIQPTLNMQVRRLTPVECERLQGFPDGYTNIPWRGKPESPDGPRYKALGNSWAVPCARWIGERIKAIRP